KVRNFNFTMRMSTFLNSQTFAVLEPERLLAVTAPVHARVMGSATTIRHQLSQSRLATPVFSAAFRRLTRPTGKLARRLSAGGQQFDYSALVNAINDNRITPAPPRETPSGLLSVDDLADRIRLGNLPPWLLWLIRNRLLILIIVLILLLLIGLITGAWIV